MIRFPFHIRSAMLAVIATALAAASLTATQSLADTLTDAENEVIRGPDRSQVLIWVQALGAADPTERDEAFERLAERADELADVLRQQLDEADNAEARQRLQRLIDIKPKTSNRQRNEATLRAAYVESFDELFPQRWQALLNDPRDARALLFVRLADAGAFWRRLAAEPPARQARFLLARVYTVRSCPETARVLTSFSGPLLLRTAAETYWPIELEPLARDGAYLWTFRATMLERNIARGVIQISIDDRRRAGDRGQHLPENSPWVHFHHFQEIAYLWRPEKPWINEAAVAYGVDRVAFTRNVLMHAVPKGVDIPTVRVTPKEISNWFMGAVYEWSREIVPRQYHKDIHFLPNPTPTAVILRPDEKKAAE